MYLINGEEVPEHEFKVPIQDLIVWRGDGIFEALRIHRGYPFGIEKHLHRLRKSAKKAFFDDVDFDQIKKWVFQVAERNQDGYVRLLISRGTNGGTSNVYLFHQPMIKTDGEYSLQSQKAPWHAGGDFDLEKNQNIGVKSTSYASNINHTRRAVQNGYQDALLISRNDIVLEGPTFAVGWIKDNQIYTPELSLGILDSVTRQYLLEIAKKKDYRLITVSANIDVVYEAEALFAMSTARHASKVDKLDETLFGSSELLNQLQQDFIDEVINERNLH